MLTGSWTPSKRLAVEIAIVFTAISNLQYRSSETVVSLRLPSYKGNNTTEQETGKQSPFPLLHLIPRIPIDSRLIFPFADSVLVCGREQLLL